VTTSAVIAGDWGTSRLRLFRLHDGRVVDRRDGPGIGALTAPAEMTFLELTADWRAAGDREVLLCGMVGSRSGWQEVPYVPCPADLASIVAGLRLFEAGGVRIAIAPGLVCRGRLGGPDVMRGEETQVLGALRLDPALAAGRQLLVLPGTHTKWVEIEDGAVVRFQTSLTGELYALLRRHSSLGWTGADQAPGSPGGFATGLARISELGAAHLIEVLFETRSRQLVEGLAPEDAAGFLSGLLIGAEVDAAAQLIDRTAAVTLIGDPALTAHYGQALAAKGRASRALAGDAAVLAGLSALMESRHAET
jgi:2-dehydro-3-deoxygalactonokinase